MADMRIAFNIDADNPTEGDLYLGNGTVRLTSNLSEEVAQELLIRFRFFKAEWFLDRTVGIPYFQIILGNKVPKSVLTQIFRQVLTTCPGVARVTEFRLADDTARRAMSLEFVVILTDGTTLKSSDFGPFLVTGV